MLEEKSLSLTRPQKLTLMGLWQMFGYEPFSLNDLNPSSRRVARRLVDMDLLDQMDGDEVMFNAKGMVFGRCADV